MGVEIAASVVDDIEIISSYTSEQAVEDGILLDILDINVEWESGIFRYITTNLIGHGYTNEDESVNIPNVLDLLNQANNIVRNQSNGFKEPKESRYKGRIESPDGKRIEIWIEMNEHGMYTIMLPKDN